MSLKSGILPPKAVELATMYRSSQLEMNLCCSADHTAHILHQLEMNLCCSADHTAHILH